MNINKQECDVLNALAAVPYVNQRTLAEHCGHSLGIVNRAVKSLGEKGYLGENMELTALARERMAQYRPKHAVILAAGFGMRMVPINVEVSKGLLKVKGEPLVERLICQLHEAGVTDIHIVVGFRKEEYEYLIDKYGVDLIVNPHYAEKNNLHSLKLALAHLEDSYIVPCDIWCAENPFRTSELYSWYMVTDALSGYSPVKVNRRKELVRVPKGADGNVMIGLAYVTAQDAPHLCENIREMCENSGYDDAFWEDALFEKDAMLLLARVEKAEKVIEINTFEQLRDLDGESKDLKSEAINAITSALGVAEKEIREITVQKKGMTNRSFLFSCQGKRYIMRIPGEGTDRLINRYQEAEVYRTIADKKLCDDIAYINSDNGYKLTVYLEGARVCDPLKVEDLKACMAKLRQFHGMELQVNHEFDIFGQMEFYESLWNGKPSAYRDYRQTKENVLSLREYIAAHAGKKVLTHIDAVPDNFLFVEHSDGTRDIRLIDWEYAGMQDPHVDVAMFCIYSLYDRAHVDQLIDLYFENNCSPETRVKIYCYIAACGLLWSNWCEYKASLGVEFGEYSLRQYRYAKDYFRIARSEMEKMEENAQ